MKAKYRYNFLLILISVTACCLPLTSFAQQLHLKGRLVGFDKKAVLEDFSDLQRMKSQNETVYISVEDNGDFQLALEISQPNYYRLGRNILYLRPGDNMGVFLNYDDPLQAKFEGTGAKYNDYLKEVGFPKAGSYLKAGRILDKDPALVYQKLLQISEERKQQLKNIKGLNSDFVTLELGRIRADLINSFMQLPGYADAKFYKEGKAFAKEYSDKFQVISSKKLNSLKTNFVDSKYLIIEVYRNIVDSLYLERATNEKEKRYILDYIAAERLAYGKIKRESDKQKLKELDHEIEATIHTKRYQDALRRLLSEKLKFGNGDLAVDFTSFDLSGKAVALSSLKGKVIYIDLWATWCGPCLAQMPDLEKLKEKYKGNDDIAIVSLSVDSNIEAWEKNLEDRKAMGIQWRINRADLKDYEVNTIPRYILIDKEFRIHELNAGSANDPLLLKMIETLLEK